MFKKYIIYLILLIDNTISAFSSINPIVKYRPYSNERIIYNLRSILQPNTTQLELLKTYYNNSKRI